MAVSTVSDITIEFPWPNSTEFAGSNTAEAEACQLKLLETPDPRHDGGLQLRVEFKFGVIDSPTFSIVALVMADGEAGIVMLTSLEIRPFRFSPVTTQVYLVSDQVVDGKEIEGLVDLQIE